MCSLTVFNILKPALLIQVSLDIGLNDDLVAWFLMSNLVNLNASRLWGIHTGEGQMVISKQPHFVSNDVYAEIQATLAGRMVSQLVDYLIESHLKSACLRRIKETVYRMKTVFCISVV